MKTERRHELRQDDLTVQIERISETVKRNATTLTSVVVGAAVLVAGVYWYRSRQMAERSEAWAALSPVDAGATPAELVDQFEQVARQGVDPAITRSAWLQVGATAMEAALTSPPEGQPAPDRKAMFEKAEAAYKTVLDEAGRDATALGQALMGLGIVAESQGKLDDARRWYQRVKEESSLAETPFVAEAEYRLRGLDNWASMIEFPEPAPAPAPPASAEGGFTPPAPGGFTPPATTDSNATDNADAAEDAASSPTGDGDSPTEGGDAPGDESQSTPPASEGNQPDGE